MKQIKERKDLDFTSIDFIQNADNVYRTKDFIVSQKIYTVFSEDTMINHLVSTDTYYVRTARRDTEYNVIFGVRGKQINGKRIASAMFTRKYVD
jgi:hypothetical protein